MNSESTDGQIPLAEGIWVIDPKHSSLTFKVRHIGLTNVRGRFNRLDANITVGHTLDDSSISATIDMSSVDTNQADRDAHLRSTDFFSTDRNPAMAFRSLGIKRDRDLYIADGELTINGITKPITLKVEFLGVQDFNGLPHAGFATSAEVYRDDYGIDFNVPLGLDKFAVGKKVDIEVDVQFVPQIPPSE